MSKSLTAQENYAPADWISTDQRSSVILSAVGDASNKRFLDVGCGQGSFLRLVQEHFPTSYLYGVCISQELLEHLPSNMLPRRASVLNLPFPDAHFDIVLCVETLERSIRLDVAVREMCRVLKPGGKIVIATKNTKQLRVEPIQQWEKRIKPEQISTLLKRYCSNVSFQHFDDSLFVLCQGVRNKIEPLDRDLPFPEISPMFDSEILRQYNLDRRRTEAGFLVRQGFQMYQDMDLTGARKAFLRAIRLDSSWLKNRGVMSIIFQSIIGYKRQARS